jgi:hypothetical protein
MTFNQTNLLSGRVPVTDYANLTADRYQFLSVNQAEPNLGPGANSTILTITTNNTRVWSNSFSVTGNIGGNYIYGNGAFLTGVQTSGSPVTNQTISGTGNTTVYTLTSTSTEDAVLVSTNGLTQAPGVDYTVSGNTITFTTAPAQGDIMQIRYLSNNLTAINNNYGNANVALFLQSGNSVEINTTGNISISGSVTADVVWLNAAAGIIAWTDESQEIYKNTTDNTMDIINHVGRVKLWSPSPDYGGIIFNTAYGSLTVDPNGNLSIFNYGNAGNTSVASFSATGNVKAGGLMQSGVYTSVIDLPSPASGGAGARAFVSTANTTAFYSIVGTGGSNTVPVFSDGTNWRVG